MDDVAVGAGVRTARLELGLRQADLAARAGVSRSTVARVERGEVGAMRVGALRDLAGVVGLRLGLELRGRGADLARTRNAHHAAMHERIARRLGLTPGWVSAAEVSFSIWGERGIIDRLAWHEATGSLVVVELKTVLTDIEDLLATMDRRARLAPTISRERGWGLLRLPVSTWVVLLDTRTNRRRVAAHRAVLRSAFPDDGRSVAGWFRHPRDSLRCLSFLPIDPTETHSRRMRASGRRCGRPNDALASVVTHDPAADRPKRPRVGVTIRA